MFKSETRTTGCWPSSLRPPGRTMERLASVRQTPTATKSAVAQGASTKPGLVWITLGEAFIDNGYRSFNCWLDSQDPTGPPRRTTYHGNREERPPGQRCSLFMYDSNKQPEMVCARTYLSRNKNEWRVRTKTLRKIIIWHSLKLFFPAFPIILTPIQYRR